MRWRTVIAVRIGSVSATSLAPGRRTRSDPSAGSQVSTGSSSPTCPASTSIITAQEVTSLVLENMR